MSTLRISNIESKADSSSPTVDEQLRFTNSDGDLMLYLDGRTAGITTVGINTTNQTIKFDANNNILITGIVTATEFHGTLAVGTSVTYGDNEKAYFGNGLDMSIHHDGTNSIIEDSGTGNLYIKSDSVISIRGTTVAIKSADNSQVLIKGVQNAGSELYYNGNRKFVTTNTGVTVTGTAVADALDISGDIDVDGHTELDNVNISGVSTYTGQARFNGELVGSIISVGNSINIADKLIHSGDPDTCVRFPANDTISFETAGSERLRIDSSGNIRQEKTGANVSLTLSRNESVGTTNQALGVIDFASNTAHTVQARVMAKSLGTSNVGGDLVIETRADGGSLDERVRFTGAGTVGISPGGIIPTAGDLATGDSQNVPIIHVKGSGVSATGGEYNLLGRFEAGGDANNTGAMIALNHSNDRGLALVGGRGTDNKSFGAIKSIDNIGRLTNVMAFGGDNGQGVEYLTFYTGNGTSTTERLRITSTGNIGVAGATGTDYSLLDGIVINTVNGSAGLIINSSSSSHNAYMSFGYGSGSGTSHADQYSAYIGRVGDNKLIFGTNNNIRASIDSNGNFNLGLTGSPAQSTTEQGVFLAGANSTQSVVSSNVTPLAINRMGTGGNDRNCIEFRNNGSLKGTVGAVGVNNGIFFQSGVTEVMRITNDYKILVGLTTTGTSTSNNNFELAGTKMLKVGSFYIGYVIGTGNNGSGTLVLHKMGQNVGLQFSGMVTCHSYTGSAYLSGCIVVRYNTDAVTRDVTLQKAQSGMNFQIVSGTISGESGTYFGIKKNAGGTGSFYINAFVGGNIESYGGIREVSSSDWTTTTVHGSGIT